MRTLKKSSFAVLAVAGAVLMAVAPSALASSTWSLASGCSANCLDTGSSALKLTSMTAFSTTGAGSAFAGAGLVSYGAGGFGVTAAGESTLTPQHSMDNSGFTDAVLLNFSSSVILRQLLVGWAAYDSDVSVLRYTGAGAPTLAGQTIAGALANGWASVGNYDTVSGAVQADGGGNNATVTNVNGSGLSSSWWLISAYNSGYGGSNFGTVGGQSDYVKLLQLTGDKSVSVSVPEPGTLALAAAALFGGFLTRRRAA